jgi:hypothetical protein
MDPLKFLNECRVRSDTIDFIRVKDYVTTTRSTGSVSLKTVLVQTVLCAIAEII